MPLTPSQSPFTYSGSELDSLAEAKNYYAWVLRQFEPFLGPTVIEAGAGIGTFSDFLLSSPKVEKLIAIEPAANTYPELASKFAGNPAVQTLRGYLSDHYKDLKANAVVAVNVLEHVDRHHEIEDTACVLERIAQRKVDVVPLLGAADRQGLRGYVISRTGDF